MKGKYYEHFRLLAYAAIFSEAQLLTADRLNQIKNLLHAFVNQFPSLYGVRILIITILFLHFTFFFTLKISNCVSIVHSLAHVHQTLFKFGPLYNYSTFNFESTVGMYD